MEIQTDEELIYVMRFHGIKKIPTIENNQYYGDVLLADDGTLRYERGDTHFYWNDDRFAFENACRGVNDVIRLNGMLDKPATVVAVRFQSEQVWKYPDREGGPAIHHVYPKTVRTETEEAWSGTLDEVFVRMEETNRRFRYCNDIAYDFRDPDIKHLHRLWGLTMDKFRSMELYYGGGIVD